MRSMTIFARGVCLSALLALTAAPAMAEGKGDRAKKAIAEAQGKVDAAGTAGAGGDAPRLTVEAQAALRTARDDFAAGHKESAIAAANHASQLADSAIAVSGQRKAQNQADAAATTAAAQQETAAAREAADAANTRAASAEQTAASASAEAQALRNTPPPAPVTTVVTTTDTTRKVAAASSRSVPKKVVRHTTTPTRSAIEQKSTTTTVTTQPNSGG